MLLCAVFTVALDSIYISYNYISNDEHRRAARLASKGASVTRLRKFKSVPYAKTPPPPPKISQKEIASPWTDVSVKNEIPSNNDRHTQSNSYNAHHRGIVYLNNN